MMMDDLSEITGIPLPGNSQHTLLFDTTRLLVESRGPFAASPVPGSWRRKMNGYRWELGITPTGQDVTLYLEILANPTSLVAAGWVADSDHDDMATGSKTIAAGDTYRTRWLPNGEARVRVVAGATAPTALAAWLRLIRDRSSGQ